MTTSSTLPAPSGTAPAAESPTEGHAGLVPSGRKREGDAAPAGEPAPGPLLDPILARVPVELDVAIPVHGFRVRHLLALAPGEVIESRWNHGEDLPLSAGHVQIAWTEFEVVETMLAARITRLA